MIRSLALLPALLAVGCRVEVQQSETLFAYDAAEDRVELVELRRGLQATEPKYARAALEELEPALAGEPVFGPLFATTLDFRTPAKGLTPAQAEAWQRVAVVEHALFLEDGERLSGIRRVRIERASEFVAALNASLDEFLGEGVREELEDDADDPSEFLLTWRRWLEASEQGFEWIRLDADALVLRAPLDPGDVGALALALSDLMREDPEAPTVLRPLLESFDAIRIADGVAEFRLEPGEDGVHHFQTPAPTEPFDDALGRLVLESPHARLLRDEPNVEALRRLLGSL